MQKIFLGTAVLACDAEPMLNSREQQDGLPHIKFEAIMMGTEQVQVDGI